MGCSPPRGDQARYRRIVKGVPDIPINLPLVLRPSRRGTIAAFGAAVLFGLVGFVVAVSGGVIVAVFCFVLAAVGLFGGIMAVLPKRTELRLDDQGFTVVSPVKTWNAAWSEVERFEADLVDMGPRSGSVAVVRVVYREGFGTAHEATSRPGKVLGVDEHYVMPGYGNLDNDQLAELLMRFLRRYGS
jgi:hypothetical protein